MSRVTSELWVSAYLRRVAIEGGFAVLRRRGSAEAGAIAVVVSRADRMTALYLQAPQSLIPADHAGDRLFLPAHREVFVEPLAVEDKLAREIRFDPDLWVIDIDERDGRVFLDVVPGGV